MDLGIVALLSVFLVPLVSYLKKEHWSVKIRFMVASAISFLVGCLVTLISGQGHITNYVAAVTTSFATMQVIYKMYFEGTLTDTKLAQL